jgi:hypothetical protein
MDRDSYLVTLVQLLIYTIYRLFNDEFQYRDYKASEGIIVKDLNGSGRGLIEVLSCYLPGES